MKSCFDLILKSDSVWKSGLDLILKFDLVLLFENSNLNLKFESARQFDNMMHESNRVRVYTFGVVTLIGGGGRTFRDRSSVVGGISAEFRRGLSWLEEFRQSFGRVSTSIPQRGLNFPKTKPNQGETTKQLRFKENPSLDSDIRRLERRSESIFRKWSTEN